MYSISIAFILQIFSAKSVLPYRNAVMPAYCIESVLGIHNEKVKRQTGKEDTDSLLPADGLNEMNFRLARNRSVRFNNELTGGGLIPPSG